MIFLLTIHSELFGLFSFGNWKFENLPISILLSIILLFIPYIFIIQSKKNYRLCKTLKKIVLKSGENCFLATFKVDNEAKDKTFLQINFLNFFTFSSGCIQFKKAVKTVTKDSIFFSQILFLSAKFFQFC